jgi:glucokinase
MANMQSKKYFAGVDIGGTKAAAVVVEVTGQDLKMISPHSTELPSEVNRGPDHVVNEVIPNVLKEALRQAGELSIADLRGIGVGFPAPISNTGGILSKANMGWDEWQGFNPKSAIEQMLEQRRDFWLSANGASSANQLFSCGVHVFNDAEATTLGLVTDQLLPDQRKDTVIGLYVGTGLGGSIMRDGKLSRNAGGGSEPGALLQYLDEDAILLGTSDIPRERHLEDFVSLVAIERQLQKMDEAGVIPKGHELLKVEATDLKSKWRARAEKLIGYAVTAFDRKDMDDWTLRPFRVQTMALGSALSNLIEWGRPDHIFIGGGISELGRVNPRFRDWYRDSIKDVANDRMRHELRRRLGFPNFLSPEKGDAAAAFGAAAGAASEEMNR